MRSEEERAYRGRSHEITPGHVEDVVAIFLGVRDGGITDLEAELIGTHEAK